MSAGEKDRAPVAGTAVCDVCPRRCRLVPGALGACRACREHGLRIGRDVRICTVNGQGTNRYTIPTITCLEPEEQSAYLKVVFSWMTQEQGAWDGPLVLQPELPKLFTGESTSGM